VSVTVAVILALLLVVALAAAALLVQRDNATRLAARQDESIARAARTIAATLTAVQRERELGVMVSGQPATNADLTTAHAETNTAVAQLETFDAQIRDIAGSVAVARDELTRLGEIRDKVISVDVVAEYSKVADSLLDLQAALLPHAGSARLSGELAAAYGLSRAHEYAAELHLLTEIGLDQRALSGPAVTLARSSMPLVEHWLTVFSLSAPQDAMTLFSAAVTTTDINAWKAMAGKMFGPDGVFAPAATAQEWRTVSLPVISKLRDTAARMLEAAVATARAADAESGEALRNLIIGVVGTTVLAAVAAVLLLRQVRRSIRLLRVATVDLAQDWLPDLLVKLRDGRATDEERRLPPRILPSNELRAVATAFEAACDQAILAVVEQNRVRSGYAEVFVNQFRRTQSLIQRQLVLIDQLENNEASPELLSKLFQLDHLVTRMRRNNENMLVLSGTELPRRPAEATPIESVIRVAMSEIEQYRRVHLVNPPVGKIVASAGTDLVRMLAELIDNATAFSPPATTVTVQAQVQRDGCLSIAVIDNGVGMSDDEVREVNDRLTRLRSTDLAQSRRVGLLVVGRLAGRHGIGVELLGGDKHVGLTALIAVPAEFVVEAERPGWADRRHAMQAAAQRRGGGSEPAGVSGNTRQNGSGLHKNARQGGGQDPATRGIAPHRDGPTGKPLPPLSRGETSVLFGPLEGPQDPASSENAMPSSKRRGELAPFRASADGRAKELLARAHADVEEELPVRTPNRLIGRPSAGKDVAKRASSAWFRARNTASQPRSVSVAAGVDDTAADDWNEGWTVVESTPRPQTYEYTDDGLPVRERGAHLVPGSARPKTPGAAHGASQQPIQRDPAYTRSRLQSFQQGVRRAKKTAVDATLSHRR
jgi:signal transduction histidine kinase